MTDVYVLAEYDHEQLSPVTAELCTAARVFGDVTAVVVGLPGTAERLSQDLAQAGAHTIVAAESADANSRFLLPAVDALSILATSDPAPIVIAASLSGNEIAGRVAARTASGVLTDVSAINGDKSAKQWIFGDTVGVQSAVGGASPVYTVRPGVITAEPQRGRGAIVTLALPAASAMDAKVTSFTAAEVGERPELTQARIVVVGGRGVGSEENFHSYVEKLADSLGAAVGATRDAVDLGYCDPQLQVGQTGVNISPDVYIGVGVSGAIQHLSGMQTARKIVAINNDEDAPIHQIADLSVVGDLFIVVPELLEQIQQVARS